MPIDEAFEDLWRLEEERRKREEEERKRWFEDHKREKVAEILMRRASAEVAAHAEVAGLEGEVTARVAGYERRLLEGSSDPQVAVVKAHLRGLVKSFPVVPARDMLDVEVVRWVTGEGFVESYINALVLREPLRRREYVMMQGLEERAFTMLTNNEELWIRLRPLGLNLICPYFQLARERKEVANLDACLIDGEEVDLVHCGRYDGCVVFRDRTGKFVTGERAFVSPLGVWKAPELLMDEGEQEALEHRLLDEIERYWRDE